MSSRRAGSRLSEFTERHRRATEESARRQGISLSRRYSDCPVERLHDSVDALEVAVRSVRETIPVPEGGS